jgi:phosphoribosylformylglycinamidine (FGAM) synthase PurS component
VRPPWQRQVVVTERLPGLFERLAPLASSAPERSIDFGAARGGYTVQRAVARMGFQRVDIVTVTATGELPTGRRITISMEELDPDATAVERNVTLVKQIAASVEQAGPRQPPGIQAR